MVMIMMRRLCFRGCSLVAVLVVTSSTLAGYVRTWGGAGNETASSVALDSSNNVYVAGSFTDTVDFNPAGPLHTNLTANGQDAFLCKYDKDGAFLWVRAWGSNGQDRVNTVDVDGKGNAYVIGCFNGTVDFNPEGPIHTTLTAVEQDAFLCKYDKDGTFQWARAWGGSQGEDGYCLAVDPAGYVYCVGDFDSTNIDFNPLGPQHDWHTNSFPWPNPTYGYDGWLCKWAPDGSFQWAKTWGGNGYDDCCSVAVDRMGNVYAGGFLGSTNDTCDFNTNTNLPHVARPLNAHAPAGSVTDAFLTKYDANGVWQWATAWGSSNYEVCISLCVDESANVYAAGYFGHDFIQPNNSALHDTVDFNPSGSASNFTSNGAGDIYLCKYDSSGHLQWVRTWGGACDEQPTHTAVDRFGYVYLSGVFKSMPCDFDPGVGVSNLVSHGTSSNDVFLCKFDSNGGFVMARSCGGIGEDWGLGVDVDERGNAYLVGSFRGTVDFSPLCGGPSANASGGSDAFLCKIPTCYQLAVTKSGNGGSSIGFSSSAMQMISLGVTTQVIYSADDWYRIQTLSSNTAAVAVEGLKTYTQTIVNAVADISNDVAFSLATPEQTGYTNVPTTWLTHWAESAIISDAVFGVHDKYLIGLDPTTSNTFALTIESCSLSGGIAKTVLKRTYTGGLSPDGMHGQLSLQDTDDLNSAFTNIPGTAASGENVFEADNRRSYTNLVNGPRQFIRAVIR
jgi:hypothetical protein